MNVVMAMQPGRALASDRRTNPWADAALLFLLAYGLRLVGLGTEPFWTDELFSLYWSQRGQEFIWGAARAHETNPPLHYAFLNLWIALVGTSEFLVRLPAATASALAVPVTYALGRTLIGRRAGLLGAVLLALSPIAITHGQEARGYPFVMLANIVALLAIARHWRWGQHALGARRLLWPAVFALAVVLAVQLHFTAILFALAAFGAIGLMLLFTRPFPLTEMLIWIGAGLAVALVSLLQLLDALALTAAPGTNWIWPLGPWTLGVFLSDFVAGSRAPMKYLGLAASVPVYALIGLTLLRHPPERRAGWIVLILTPALFVALLIGISLVRPLMISRYGLWLVVPVCLLAAHAVLAWRGALRVLAIAVVLFGWGTGFVYHLRDAPRDDWRRLAAALEADPACSGPVVFGSFSAPIGLVHYAPQLRTREMLMIDMPAERDAASETLLGIWMLGARPIERAEVVAMAREGAHPVLVLRTFDLRVMDDAMRALTARARPIMREDSWVSAWCL